MGLTGVIAAAAVVAAMVGAVLGLTQPVDTAMVCYRPDMVTHC